MTDGSARYFDLHCYVLKLVSERSDFTRQLDWFVKALEIHPPEAAGAKLQAEIFCRETEGCNFAEGFEGIEPTTVQFEIYGEVQLLEGPKKIRYFKPDVFCLTLDGQNMSAELEVSPECPHRYISLGSIMAFDHSTRAGKACLIHSACLDTKQGQRFLMLAESGVGKTTTSLKLARSGMPLSGDDTTLVWIEDGHCVGFGIPRPARVSKDALTRVAGLKEVVEPDKWDSGDEQELTREQLSTFVTVSEIAPKPIEAVIRLTRSRKGRASVVVTAPAEAMSATLAENITMARSGMTEHQMERFELYAHLFGNSACLQLELGSDDANFISDLEAAIQS